MIFSIFAAGKVEEAFGARVPCHGGFFEYAFFLEYVDVVYEAVVVTVGVVVLEAACTLCLKFHFEAKAVALRLVAGSFELTHGCAALKEVIGLLIGYVELVFVVPVELELLVVGIVGYPVRTQAVAVYPVVDTRHNIVVGVQTLFEPVDAGEVYVLEVLVFEAFDKLGHKPLAGLEAVFLGVEIEHFAIKFTPVLALCLDRRGHSHYYFVAHARLTKGALAYAYCLLYRGHCAVELTVEEPFPIGFGGVVAPYTVLKAEVFGTVGKLKHKE